MRYLNIILVIAVSFLTIGCEKIIEVDLNSTSPQYVIEAIITDQPGSAVVEITQTKNFNDDNNFKGVSGAIVTMAEQNGVPVTLAESSSGVYKSSTFTGHSGKSYLLIVQIGNKSFSAVSSMPQKVNLDTLYITDENLFSEPRKTANLEYLDPPGRGNNYRFIQYVNGKKENQIYTMTDDYTDGNKINTKLFYFTEEDDDPLNIKSGSQVRVEMMCIDSVVYKYWYSLSRSATGTSGQATPANPVTNIQGGALGYFSAQTYQSKTVIAP